MLGPLQLPTGPPTLNRHHPAVAPAVPVERDGTENAAVVVREAGNLQFQLSLLNALGQSVVAVDTAGRVTYWNGETERLLGWRSGDAVGRALHELAVIFDQEADTHAALALVADGTPWSGNWWMRHRSGRRFPAHLTATALFSADGTFNGAVAVTTDVSEREQAEKEVRRLSALVESSGDAIYSARLDGIITSWNARAEELYGYTEAEALGRNVMMLIKAADGPWLRQALDAVTAGEPITEPGRSFRRRSGETVQASLTISPIYEDGELTGFSGVARNITEQLRLRDELERERDRLMRAHQMAGVGGMEIDLISGKWWSSEQYSVIHGLTHGDGQHSEDEWLATIHPEDRDDVRRRLLQVRTGGAAQTFDYRIIRPRGETTWARSLVKGEVDNNGFLVKVVSTTMDVTESKHNEGALARLAYEDSLTGLANRARLSSDLEVALEQAAAKRQQVAVLFIDMDRLKFVNDGMGHAAGDELLVQLASRLRVELRTGDLLARFAGDEFVVVAKSVTECEARRLAERMGQAARRPFMILGQEVFTSISIGIALSSEGDTAESLLHHADAAMYRSKENGQGRAVVFDEDLQRQAVDRVTMESQLPRAVDRGQLELYYQPIVSVATGRPVALEALMRWHRPDHGQVTPETFIPAAERTGQIVPMGQWALAEALSQVKRWRAELPQAADLRVAVNLSARQLQVPDFDRQLLRTLEAAGVPPSALELEVTESVLMRDVESSMQMLSAVRKVGVGIAIDDFGTGYSSLSYLNSFPITTLKVDRSFITGLCSGTGHERTLVETIISMAAALSMDVVAEGVEDSDQVSALHRLGAGLAQGYHWSKPIPADEVLPWLQEQYAAARSAR